MVKKKVSIMVFGVGFEIVASDYFVRVEMGSRCGSGSGLIWSRV